MLHKVGGGYSAERNGWVDPSEFIDKYIVVNKVNRYFVKIDGESECFETWFEIWCQK